MRLPNRTKYLLFGVIVITALVMRLFYIRLIPLNIDEAKLIEEMLKFDWAHIPVQFFGHGTGEYLMLGALWQSFVRIF